MNTDPIEQLRTDRAALEQVIREAGSTIKGDGCTCPHPGHEDRHPSASIYADPAGVWRVTCHSRRCLGKGADLFDLRAALTGRPVADLLREARSDGRVTAKPRASAKRPATRTAAPPTELLALARRCTAALTDEQRDTLADRLGLTADALDRLRLGWHDALSAYTFPMRDEHGNIIGVRTRHADGRKRAAKNSANGLFIPSDLPAGGTLYIAEGPTDTAALIDCGLSAIGRPSNTAGEDLIVGCVRENPRDAVVILHDADGNAKTAQATSDAALRLAGRLVPLVGDVRIIQPPTPHKDARAWRIAGATADDIEAVADTAASLGPAGELRAMFEAEARGERQAIAWPWNLVTRGTQALIPGTTTLIVGDPGSGKSLWLLEALAHWHDAGLPVAGFMLERSRAEHLRRALAQRTGAAWLTDLEGTAGRSAEAMAVQSEHAGWLDRFGRTLHTPGDEAVTLRSLIDWTAERAAEGSRLIAIDPITIADTSDRPWDDARQFLRDVGRIIDRAGASLLLVTHPAKIRGRASGGLRTLDDLAGGSAWARFADTVLWLERHDAPKVVSVREGAFPVLQSVEVERTLRVMKARHGRGSGWQLAVTLNPDTLRFDERGAIARTETAGRTGHG